MMKRLLSILLALVMCLSFAACATPTDPNSTAKEGTDESKATEAVSGAETAESPETVPGTDNTEAAYDCEPERQESDTLTWEFNAATGALSIHGEGPMRDYSETAPEWEQYSDQILTVTLDDGITSVGAYAFYNYPHLTEAQLPDSVEVIDVYAFDYNWELRTITIPASLKYVGERAFYNTLLWEPENLIFPEGCEYIGDAAFHSALKSGGSVSLPSTLKYLGTEAFTNAFLSDFIVSPDNETYCSENHAIYTKDRKELLMVAPIADYSGEFRIPDGVEKLYPECFNVIREIETVYIPASVTDIPEGTFFSTFELKQIIVDEANPNYKSENGLLLSKDGKVLLAWPDGIEATELVIPEGVERIGTYLFYGRLDSCSVVLPESVKEIGTMSLPAAMTSLNLPVGLETIDEYVFYDGISVDSITYDGTAADWEKITVGDGNDALNSAVIHMN